MLRLPLFALRNCRPITLCNGGGSFWPIFDGSGACLNSQPFHPRPISRSSKLTTSKMDRLGRSKSQIEITAWTRKVVVNCSTESAVPKLQKCGGAIPMDMGAWKVQPSVRPWWVGICWRINADWMLLLWFGRSASDLRRDATTRRRSSIVEARCPV